MKNCLYFIEDSYYFKELIDFICVCSHNNKRKDIQHLLFFSFFLNKCELDSIQFVIKSFKFLL